MDVKYMKAEGFSASPVRSGKRGEQGRVEEQGDISVESYRTRAFKPHGNRRYKKSPKYKEDGAKSTTLSNDVQGVGVRKKGGHNLVGETMYESHGAKKGRIVILRLKGKVCKVLGWRRI